MAVLEGMARPRRRRGAAEDAARSGARARLCRGRNACAGACDFVLREIRLRDIRRRIRRMRDHASHDAHRACPDGSAHVLRRCRPSPRRARSIADDRDQAVAAIADLLADARHEIAIYTRDLDPALFDVPPILEAIKRIALSGRRARVRILVQEPRRPLADGHRLIALAQRLPSLIELRTPLDEQDRQYASAFLINDRRGYLFRTLGEPQRRRRIDLRAGPARATARIFRPGLGALGAERGAAAARDLSARRPCRPDSAAIVMTPEGHISVMRRRSTARRERL